MSVGNILRKRLSNSIPKFIFSAGFVIFYDLVLNLDPRVTACRLIVGLHGVSAQMGEPTLMPTVYTEPVTRGGAYASNNSNAIIGARQPVPKYVISITLMMYKNGQWHILFLFD